MNLRKAGLLLALLVSAFSSPAAAQDYPSRPVRLVVPFPAGGGTDFHARIVTQKLSDMLGQQFIVDNRVGASGHIGYDHVAKSAPDGYTLVMGSGSLTIAPTLYPNLPFDPLKDFIPISLVVKIQNAMVVHPSVPAKTVAEFIALAKSKPGQLNYASTGIGNPPHLCAELFKSMTGVEMAHIPYKGDTPALTDILGGHVQMFMAPMAGAMTHIQEGKLRPLAVTGSSRAVPLPDVPTMAEAGLPGYELTSWFGVLAPAGTSQPIVDKLNAALVKIVAMPDVRERFIGAGSDPASTSVEEFQTLMRNNVASFAKIIEKSGAKLE